MGSMSNTIEMSHARGTIEAAKRRTQSAKDRLLHVLTFVPDDKDNYKPFDTCKSTVEILAHVAVSNRIFADIIALAPRRLQPVEQIFGELGQEESGLKTRAQALSAFEQTHAAVMSALDHLGEDQVFAEVETSVMNGPMTFFMDIPAMHYAGHTAQIEYLQTCWGDMDFHFH